jgi:hypothetical protein
VKCIVPLAGPDLWSQEFGLRPLYDYLGTPLIKYTLQSRSWVGQLRAEDYIFVVRDIPQASKLFDFLNDTWPGCSVVKLPHLTDGAMLSVLAGLSLVRDGEVVICDLADIIFDIESGEIDFHSKENVGMIVPVFSSTDPVYSYLRFEHGVVVEAREKIVISDMASAGVYVFVNRATYMAAAAYAVAYPSISTYKGNFFICPMVNGVVSMKLSVLAPAVKNVLPVGKIFHST